MIPESNMDIVSTGYQIFNNGDEVFITSDKDDSAILFCYDAAVDIFGELVGNRNINLLLLTGNASHESGDLKSFAFHHLPKWVGWRDRAPELYACQRTTLATEKGVQLTVINVPTVVKHVAILSVIDIGGISLSDGRKALTLNEEVGIINVNVEFQGFWFSGWLPSYGVSSELQPQRLMPLA